MEARRLRLLWTATALDVMELRRCVMDPRRFIAPLLIPAVDIFDGDGDDGALLFLGVAIMVVVLVAFAVTTNRGRCVNAVGARRGEDVEESVLVDDGKVVQGRSLACPHPCGHSLLPHPSVFWSDRLTGSLFSA
jgi:hypothetical protein